MTGFRSGSSQRSTAIRSSCARATQPAVGPPVDTCRKNAEPAFARNADSLRADVRWVRAELPYPAVAVAVPRGGGVRGDRENLLRAQLISYGSP